MPTQPKPHPQLTISQHDDTVYIQQGSKRKALRMNGRAITTKDVNDFRHSPVMNVSWDLFFSIVPVMIMARVLSKFLDLPRRMPLVSRVLNLLWVPALALAALSLVVHFQTKLLDEWYQLGAYVLLLLVLVALRHYRPARTLLLGAAPYIGYLALELALNLWDVRLLKRFDDQLDSTRGFAVIWLFTFGMIARGQKKTLLREETERAEAEKARQLIAAQNVRLEEMVAERTAALTRQAEALQETLTELKTTQAQLIQAEKMASLGELTAGIAHEIQNPLNFVNNFSEVSVELLQELQEGPFTKLPAAEQEYAAELLGDLVTNLQKITTHGKRADSIVKGMLQHSRASTGERAPTDVNALADEYLRLSYHGLRAKDKSFNATLTTNFEPDLPLVEAAGQEVGRVLLNMFTNAFYATQQRQKLAQPGYAPEVRVSTRRLPDGDVEIRVRDNGTGMPESVKAKVFQPFFTTKPSGEGTGLGLSLSHDIIVKGHGGTLQVESRPGEFTEFIITLPA